MNRGYLGRDGKYHWKNRDDEDYFPQGFGQTIYPTGTYSSELIKNGVTERQN